MLVGGAATVDQRRASPGGDAVGRDKITHVHHSERKTQIEGWLDRLAEEMRGNVQARELVDTLQYYFQYNPYDSVIGLENKLDFAGRTQQKRAALRKKEAFRKLLEEWKSYPAAQEIIAYFLTKIEVCFETDVVPALGIGAIQDIDALIKTSMIDPIMNEMGPGPFMLNYNHVAGMVYWLAEQCYVRWHA